MACCQIDPCKDLERWETSYSVALANADNYYTKEEVDKKITSSKCDCDFSDYYTIEETNDLLDEKADVDDLSAHTANASIHLDQSDVQSMIDATTSAYTLTTDFSAHTASTSIHTTQSDKDRWNAKQDALTPGSGITIVNNVISSTGGGGSVVVDPSLNSGSTNPVANSAITNAFADVEEQFRVEAIAMTDLQSDLSGHTEDTTVHITQAERNYWNAKPDSTVLNNYMLKSQIWCGTQTEYDNLPSHSNDIIYLIHQ